MGGDLPKSHAGPAAKAAAVEERMKTHCAEINANMERLGNRIILAVVGVVTAGITVLGLIISRGT